MSKIQLKIMCVLALLVVVVVGAVGLLAERGIRQRITSQIREHLEHQARLLDQMVADFEFAPERGGELEEIVRLASISADARITLIDKRGRVLADSAVPIDELANLSNHADRPEVIEALKGGFGSSIRRSDTLKRSLLYVAYRVDPTFGREEGGIIRLAVHLGQVEAASAGLRRDLMVAGGVGLLFALGLSYLLSLLSLRPIMELRDVVADIAEGKLERRLQWESGDERGEIARSINRLARRLRDSADDALREKSQLEAVLSSMVEGVIVIDAEGRVLLANPRARELLSIWGEFIGRPIPEVVRSPGVDDLIIEASNTEGIVVREIEVDAEKRRVLLMHASGFPETPPRTGTVAVFHDVTELRRVDAVRRDFIANASHELRTPLTSIRGFADTLSTTAVSPEELSKYLDVIVRNAERMSDLIDDLLALSRAESGTTHLELTSVDVKRLVETVVTDFAPRFREQSIDVLVHAADVPMCRADRGAVEQILSNLLSNAARYTNPGGRVDVWLEAEDEFVVMRVEDTGIGIAPSDLERIFERFYRVDAARSRAVGSTGLGLSIVRHLVRALGGEISVESKVGKGTIFQVRLRAV